MIETTTTQLTAEEAVLLVTALQEGERETMAELWYATQDYLAQQEQVDRAVAAYRVAFADLGSTPDKLAHVRRVRIAAEDGHADAEATMLRYVHAWRRVIGCEPLEVIAPDGVSWLLELAFTGDARVYQRRGGAVVLPRPAAPVMQRREGGRP